MSCFSYTDHHKQSEEIKPTSSLSDRNLLKPETGEYFYRKGLLRQVGESGHLQMMADVLKIYSNNIKQQVKSVNPFLPSLLSQREITPC